MLLRNSTYWVARSLSLSSKCRMFSLVCACSLGERALALTSHSFTLCVNVCTHDIVTNRRRLRIMHDDTLCTNNLQLTESAGAEWLRGRCDWSLKQMNAFIFALFCFIVFVIIILIRLKRILKRHVNTLIRTKNEWKNEWDEMLSIANER